MVRWYQEDPLTALQAKEEAQKLAFAPIAFQAALSLRDLGILAVLDAAGDDGRVLGNDPLTGHEIVAKAGRYGPYVTELEPEPEAEVVVDAATGEVLAEEKPKKKGAKKAAAPKPRTASLFKDMDVATVDLDTALRLLDLPRTVGDDPESGEPITAQNGRYGPYLKRGTDSRSLTSEEQIFDITLDEALAIYAQPKTRGRAAAAAPLKEFGNDPVSGKPVVLKSGRFVPYVTDGETNATLRRDDSPEEISNERAFELIAEKRAKGPAPKRKPAARKTTTRKAPAKKAPAKKAPAKKASS